MIPPHYPLSNLPDYDSTHYPLSNLHDYESTPLSFE
jgi:hypothetical protein